VLTLPSHRLAVVVLGGVVEPAGVVEAARMVEAGGVEVAAPLPPPPQLAAHTAIKITAVIRRSVAGNTEIPIYSALGITLS
jgi:hypothetical protein